MAFGEPSLSNTQVLRIDDFTGGKTDKHINARPNQFEDADNFLITSNKKLESRKGLVAANNIENTSLKRISPGGDDRIGNTISFESELFYRNNNHLNYIPARVPPTPTTHVVTELLGPTTNPIFPPLTDGEDSFIAHDQWNGHLILTSDDYDKPQKIYKDDAGDFQLRTAGMPSLATAPTVTPSALTKVGDTNSSTTITGLPDTTGIEVGATITGVDIPAGTTVAAINSPTSIEISQAATGTTVGVTFTFGVSTTYVYHFLYFYEYKVGDETFQDFGPTTLVEVTSADPSAASVTISAIPAISNGAVDNYAEGPGVDIVKVQIYRTEANGTIAYKIAELDNGTAGYVDSDADSAINTNLIIYTDAGVYDNDPPPLCRYCVVANDITWYANTKDPDTGDIFPARLRQSIKFDPDSCPTQFFIDVEDGITGLGNVGIYPIVFTKTRVFRIEGSHDETGRGFLDKREISRATGCISHDSIVNTLKGVYFAGNNGFYFTDGFQVEKVSDEINETFLALSTDASSPTAQTLKRKRISGLYDSRSERVFWTAQKDTASTDNDSLFVMDTRWGYKEASSLYFPFTTLSGAEDSFSPASIAIHNNEFMLSDRRGYPLKLSDTVLFDIKVDTTADIDTWVPLTVIYDHKSMTTDYGTSAIRKWVPKVVFMAQNLTNISVGLFSNNDDSGVFRELREVRNSSNVTWGDAGVIWDDQTLPYRWNTFRLIEGNRRFPAGTLRCTYKQLRITNAFTIVHNSDTFGNCSLDAAAKTVTLLAAPTLAWPSDVVDYFILFEDDNYVNQFQILTRTDSVLTFADVSGLTTTDADIKWILKGFRKGEQLNLISYNTFYDVMTDSTTKFKGDTGANA